MIRQVIANHLSGNYSAFLFGSQAGLPELKRADIDVGIDAKRPLSNLEEILIWAELEDLPTLYKFDLVDFARVDPGFRKIALNKIEIL